MKNKDNADPMKDAPSGNSADNKFPIVAIGASARGIKALKDFFSHVPSN